MTLQRASLQLISLETELKRYVKTLCVSTRSRRGQTIGLNRRKGQTIRLTKGEVKQSGFTGISCYLAGFRLYNRSDEL